MIQRSTEMCVVRDFQEDQFRDFTNFQAISGRYNTTLVKKTIATNERFDEMSWNVPIMPNK